MSKSVVMCNLDLLKITIDCNLDLEIIVNRLIEVTENHTMPEFSIFAH